MKTFYFYLSLFLILMHGLLPLHAQGESVKVPTIEALRGYRGSADVIDVTDSVRGGVFRRLRTKDEKEDGGVVIRANDGSLWKRDAISSVKVEWFLDKALLDYRVPFQLALDAAANYGVSKVVFPPGDYPISVSNDGVGLRMRNGVGVEMRGTTLRLLSNDLPSYNVIFFGEEVKQGGITGGAIIGDKSSHSGNRGEWGMCIGVRGSSNVRIENVKIRECWGDGIYIGRGSAERNIPKNIILENLEVAYNRRNNISIVAASDYAVSNVLLHHAGGTSPGAGIDVEPNRQDSANNGVLRNIRSYANRGYGVLVANNRRYGEVSNLTLCDVVAEDNGSWGVLIRGVKGLNGGSISSINNKGGGVFIRESEAITLNKVDVRGYLPSKGGTWAGIRAQESSNVVINRVSVTDAKYLPRLSHAVFVLRNSEIKIGELSVDVHRLSEAITHVSSDSALNVTVTRANGASTPQDYR